jgi:hypothetical protein
MNDTQQVTAHVPISGKIMEDVIARGDLSKLSAEDRVVYYNKVCESVGLNPLTRPLLYITLSGRLVLYATRDAADQLRKINGINIEITSHTVNDGLLTVHVRATDRTGRVDEDFGVVSVAALRGDSAANAFMKGVTKAKRRVTLSISGLGFLDETETEADEEVWVRPHNFQHLAKTEDLGDPLAKIEAPAPPPHDPVTGETGPRALPLTEEGWRPWAQQLIAYVRSAPSAAVVEQWLDLNVELMAQMKEEEPKMYRLLDAAITEAQKVHDGR